VKAPLSEYRTKRRFRKTPEPAGRTASEKGRLFVVQRHASRRLHYDFRLQWGGVLKSWAVPKGPSFDPREKRLAVHVEDHPVEYGSFEGDIPKGEYGAGRVILWDRGEWIPEGDPEEGLEKGKLAFELRGGKYRGRWALVSMRDGKNWLLIKEKDEHVRPRPALPQALPFELCTLVRQAPEGDEWLHEIKFDGYRLMARVEDGDVRLLTRNGLDWSRKLPGLVDSLRALAAYEAVLDGELVALDERGRSSFQALQNAFSDGRAARLAYYAFDLLWLDGFDLRSWTLEDRKKILEGLIPEKSRLRFSGHIRGRGPVFLRQACGQGLEGVVSKRADSPYAAGRGRSWVKSKCTLAQEFVIAGYTKPSGSRAEFGALLLGLYEESGKLRYAGRVGTGFDEALLRSLGARLKTLRRKSPAFANPPPGKGVTWTEPVLVAEVAYTGWTDEKVLRHPSFKGLRADKPAPQVRPERPASAVRLTHPDRVVYPELGVTKKDLAAYYEAVADRMLPHAAGRPLALVRCPAGRQAHCFFHKHWDASWPGAVRGAPIEEGGKLRDTIYIEDLPGLISLVQMGVLEIHGWGCRVADVEHPDRAVFDLDPAPDVSWKRVVAAARLLGERLKAEGLAPFVKTTGGKGLHVVVAVKPKRSWDELKAWSKEIALSIVEASPKDFLARMPKSERAGKILIDYFRNGRGATAVLPYSPRAREGAPVATPIAWDELTPKLDPKKFTVLTLPRRLASLRIDPWAQL
jgi:bifunctional non-homologous end joining protein LigD